MPQRYQSLRQVELHDVWPSLQDECRVWIDACARAGLRPHLLVVPRRGGDLISIGEGLPEDFCVWLAELAAQGYPLWMHGLTHCHPEGGDAEFRELDGEEMRRRIDLGRRDWNSAGLPGFVGFCAPCWKSSCVLPRMAALEGIGLTASRWGVRDGRGLRFCPALTSWGPGLFGKVWDRTLGLQARLLLALGIPWRLVLHPQDLDTAAGSRLLAVLERLGRDQSSLDSSASVS